MSRLPKRDRHTGDRAVGGHGIEWAIGVDIGSQTLLHITRRSVI
jgi:hypothetical protein